MEEARRMSVMITRAERLRVLLPLYIPETVCWLCGSSWRVNGCLWRLSLQWILGFLLSRIGLCKQRNWEPNQNQSFQRNVFALRFSYFLIPTCLHSGRYPLSSEDRFNLWYRPIYEARRLILVRLLIAASYSLGRRCCGPQLSGRHNLSKRRFTSMPDWYRQAREVVCVSDCALM